MKAVIKITLRIDLLKMHQVYVEFGFYFHVLYYSIKQYLPVYTKTAMAANQQLEILQKYITLIICGTILQSILI